MPAVLPTKAIEHVPDTAQEHLIAHANVESFTTIAYHGINGGVPVEGLIVEVDPDTWVENNLFTFQEVSESNTQVVLYDASRDTTITINLVTNDFIVSFGSNELVWTVDDVSRSLAPVIPDGWIV
jgi:hypothetical protein